jgi:hypothetical protein
VSLDILTKAISQQVAIMFEYNKPGKISGLRTGNPHAVFIMRRNDGSESTKVHIVQTDGVSDSSQALPSFRMFDLSELTNVQIIYPTLAFNASPEYNPQWDGYKFVIAKI